MREKLDSPDVRVARVAERQHGVVTARQAGVLGFPIGDEAGHSDRIRSELERRFLAICRRHRLSSPEVNVCASGRSWSTSSGASSA